jgi:hypothetical protein
MKIKEIELVYGCGETLQLFDVTVCNLYSGRQSTEITIPILPSTSYKMGIPSAQWRILWILSTSPIKIVNGHLGEIPNFPRN